MAKKKQVIAEESLLLPSPPSSSKIIDTHTHLASTFEAYRAKYKEGKYETVFDFVKGVFADRNVEAIVDVWCEAPVRPLWKEFADSALTQEDRDSKWGGLEYWFVMGVHPHEAKLYNDQVEADILEAMQHPRCVGWGEMGLDYHYDNSPRDIQQDVFIRQLKQAVKLGKPLTIHTREADEDTERILKEHVPKDHRIHIHCFTDTPEFGGRLLTHFPNLNIGITGVLTYSTNLNTFEVVRRMQPDLRIILETDAPYMVPSNLYGSLAASIKGRLPLCHSAMVPWTAQFLAEGLEGWDADKVMERSRDNARNVYGI